MSDDVRNSVLSHGSLDDPAEFELCLFSRDFLSDESSFDIDQDSVVLLQFVNAQHVYRNHFNFSNLPMRPSGNLGSLLTLLSTRRFPLAVFWVSRSLQMRIASCLLRANLR